jgi:RNA polymerase subunit RPABC4/transcription elongation factor Spt4
MTDRHCKNCNSLIYAGKSYCSDCGAKWIDNRITIKQVGNDFADMYIGIDTKFVRTFVDLFKAPEKVIAGYIQGRRVNYMDSIRYLLLALFITGIYTLVLKETNAFEQMLNTEEMYESMNYSDEQLAFSKKYNSRLQKGILDYQGLFYFLTIPILALVGRLTFWGKRFFNFPEQIVFYMYTYSHITIFTTPISILIVLFLDIDFITYWGFISFLLMLLYNARAYKRCFGLNMKVTVLKTLLALLLILTFMILITIIAMAIGILGVLLAKKMGWANF